MHPQRFSHLVCILSIPCVVGTVLTIDTTAAHAQSDRVSAMTCSVNDRCSLSGRITNQSTGEPVVGAFVSAGTTADSPSVLSDGNGVFTLQDLRPGIIEVSVVADLYKPTTIRLEIRNGGEPLSIQLVDDDKPNGEIVYITDKAPNVVEPPSYDITATELRVLPGSGNDALGAIQSLPGVARVPFGLGGLVLRGASPRDSNVYLDGVEVPLLFHFGGLASFMPSTMLDSLELIPGGFSARYGRAQGGIVDLQSKPGRRDRWRIGSEVSLLDASVRAEGPGFGGGAWTIGVRRSYVDAILAAVVPDDSSVNLTIAPRYYDAQLRYDVALPSSPDVRESLSAMIFASDDRMRFLGENDDEPAEGPDRFEYISSFVRAAVRWKRNQGDVDMTVTPWIGIDKNSLRFNDEGITRTSVPMGGRANITRSFDSGYLSGGIDVQGGRYTFDINNEPPPGPGSMDVPGEGDPVARDGTVWYADTAFWLEGMYKINDGKLGLKPGIRAERYGLTDSWVVDPRLNVSQKLTPWLSLEQAVGLYHQPPIFADLDPVFGNENLGSSYAVQASFGAKAEKDGFKASATGFYDQAYDLPVDVVTQATSAASPGSALSGGVAAISREFTTEQFGSYSYQENVGRGRNYGVEMMLEASRGSVGKAGSFMAWLSYTYSRSLRRDDPMRYTEYRPYVLDQPHVLTALGTVQITDNWRLGARVRFATGNPFTPVEDIYFDTDAQSYESIPGELLSDRLPSFFQLDVRIDRTWKRSWGTIGLFLDVQNATNRVNPEGVSYNFDFSEREYTRGLPIFPSLGVEYTP